MLFKPHKHSGHYDEEDDFPVKLRGNSTRFHKVPEASHKASYTKVSGKTGRKETRNLCKHRISLYQDEDDYPEHEPDHHPDHNPGHNPDYHPDHEPDQNQDPHLMPRQQFPPTPFHHVPVPNRTNKKKTHLKETPSYEARTKITRSVFPEPPIESKPKAKNSTGRAGTKRKRKYNKGSHNSYRDYDRTNARNGSSVNGSKKDCGYFDLYGDSHQGNREQVYNRVD